MQTLQAARASNSTSITTSAETLEDYDLGGVDCPLCGNTGRLIEQGPGLLELHVRECACMRKRRSLRSLRRSGMADMARRYTFAAYQTDSEHRRAVKAAAERFVQADEGWFFIAGQSGSGKSHICTAICAALIERGLELSFLSWRDEAPSLKASVTEREQYETRMKKLKSVPVLYIDDFLKGKITEADVNLAFEILNARYNNAALRTVLSSEWKLDELLQLDEALGGRICERARGFTVLAPPDNWRLRPTPQMPQMPSRIPAGVWNE